MSQTELTVLGLVFYVLAGCAIGAMLHRAGHGSATCSSALVAWPMLLPLLGDAPPPRVASSGPFSSRIDQAFSALVDALGDPAAGEAPWEEEVGPLRASLVEADRRVAFVDRLLEGDVGSGHTLSSPGGSGHTLSERVCPDPTADDPTADPVRGKLTAAREHAASEIEEVLHGVVELRLQVGLLALAGKASGVREQLRAFHARARALAEVSELAAG